MPLNLYDIKPSNIARTLQSSSQELDELESVSNLKLANLIRQLSSLGQRATNIFDGLIKDAVKINTRSQILNQRIQNLKVIVIKLPENAGKTSLDNFQSNKQFKSIKSLEQNVVGRDNMPDEMKILYEQAESPPNLFEFNCFRQDGIDSMKIFSDPGFFFNVWSDGIIKTSAERKAEKQKNKLTKRNNQTNAQSEKNAHNFEEHRLPPPPPPPILSNITDSNELPLPPDDMLINRDNEENFPIPPKELLNYDEENYYVNLNNSNEQQESGYINANALQIQNESYSNKSDWNSLNTKSEIVKMRQDAEIKIPNSNKNRISTFLEEDKVIDTKQQLNQAIVLGAFKLKKTVVDNTRKEKSSEHFLAREPNVLSILTLASENLINDAENDDEDDDEW